MKVLYLSLLVLLLGSFSVKAQESEELDLPVAKALLNFIMKQEVTNDATRQLLISEIENKVLSHSDSLLVNIAKVYVMKLESLDFPNCLSTDDEELSIFSKKKFVRKYDKFKKQDVIQHKHLLTSPLVPIIVVNNNCASLMIKYNYSGRDWVFADVVEILIDDEVNRIDLKDVDRKVSGSGVREINIEYASSKEIDILNKILSTNQEVMLRFSGKYRADFTLDKKELEAIRQLFSMYNELSL